MNIRFRKLSIGLLSLSFIWIAGCKNRPSSNQQQNGIAALSFDTTNGGLTLPPGFKAVVVGEHLGRTRHIVIRDNGDIYAALNSMNNGGGIVALRDTNGDGKADIIRYFGDGHGTGMGIYKGYLYFGTDTAILRYKLQPDSLLPDPRAELVASLPAQQEHEMKSITFDGNDNLYVNVGAPSNSCQVDDRTKGSPGMSPCTLLQWHAGIWRFKADQLNQTQEKDGYHYATGLRNCVALTWNPHENQLYAVMHGRDQLSQLFPQYYTDSMSAELPGEEFIQIKDGGNYGWPYAYYDQNRKKLMIAPEYGGDGKKAVPEGKYLDPMMAFPGHWAPDGLLFYTGTQFPASYRYGAFIAFHGSWNRAPLLQRGYDVVFVPFSGGKPSGDYTVFANGFAGTDNIKSPGDAKHRPTGLAQGPDGSLYVTDDANGTIWRIVYTGK